MKKDFLLKHGWINKGTNLYGVPSEHDASWSKFEYFKHHNIYYYPGKPWVDYTRIEIPFNRKHMKLLFLLGAFKSESKAE